MSIFQIRILEYLNPRRWYSISLYNAGWKCQSEDAHVACCVTLYWLSNRYTKLASFRCRRIGTRAHRMRSSYANWQRPKSPVLRGVSCVTVFIPETLDSIWVDSAHVDVLRFVSGLPLCSLSFSLFPSPSLAIFRLSHLPCTRTRSFAPSPEVRVCADNNCKVRVNKRMHALIRTRSQGRR